MARTSGATRTGIVATVRPRPLSLMPAAIVALVYAAAGAFWILASEWLLGWFVPAENTALIQVIKGLGFVAVTSVALYLVLGRMMRELAEGVRTQASLAARLQEHAAQQRLLAHRLMQAEEETRREVAKDLHDGPLQALTLSFMRLDAATRNPQAPIDAAQVSDAMAAIKDASGEIRSVLRALHPPLLAELGLSAALERHCEEAAARSGREIRFTADGSLEGALHPDLAIAGFRITQEAISNALKHTTGDPIRVRIDLGEGAVNIDVEDQGPGFNPDMKAGAGLGLLSMRERAESIGGTLAVESVASGGTRVRARLPLRYVDARATSVAQNAG